MPIFEIRNRKAKKVNTKEFKNELELHQLIDMNLEEIFGVRFIKDEHITDKHGRIETLGLVTCPPKVGPCCKLVLKKKERKTKHGTETLYPRANHKNTS